MAQCVHGIAHDVRDGFYRLRHLRSEWRDRPPGPRDAVNRLHADSERLGQKTVDSLAHILTEFSGATVCACVKVFYRPGLKTINSDRDLEKAEVVTLCRSHNSHNRRRTLDRPHRVDQNTDFLEIISRGKSFYGAVDLLAEKRAGRYQNSTLNWENFYLSTVVVPIRLMESQFEEGYPGGNTDKKYTLQGFVCVDSLSVEAFPDDRIEHYAEFLMMVGDSLYHYLDLAGQLEDEFTQPQKSEPGNPA